MIYEWLRAGHIISVIALMAGLLMYPRLLVYRLEAEGDARFEAAMDKAATNLRRIILNPALGLTWLFGLGMIGQQWEYLHIQPWFWVKIVLVVALTALDGWLMGVGRKVAAGLRPVPARRLRMLNELPMVIAIAAVIMVVVQPFSA